MSYPVEMQVGQFNFSLKISNWFIKQLFMRFWNDIMLELWAIESPAPLGGWISEGVWWFVCMAKPCGL